MTDYYDGPRGGVAELDGTPWVYRSIYLDTSQWDPDEDRFELSPITPEILALALEDWAIWQRWEDAFYAGKTGAETQPALPDDAARHAEIAAVLERALVIDAERRILAHAEFRVRQPVPASYPGKLRPLEVRWLPRRVITRPVQS